MAGWPAFGACPWPVNPIFGQPTPLGNPVPSMFSMALQTLEQEKARKKHKTTPSQHRGRGSTRAEHRVLVADEEEAIDLDLSTDDSLDVVIKEEPNVPTAVQLTGWRRTVEDLQVQIVRLEDKIRGLNRHADDMIAARSPSLVAQTIARLAGVFANREVFHVALANLSFAVGAPTMNRWYTDDEALLELFSRSLRVLLMHIDPIVSIGTLDDEDINACRPPDVLWLLIGTGDPVLYHPLQHALITMLDGCRGTRRGVTLQVLLDRLQRQWNEPFYSRAWRERASRAAREFDLRKNLLRADRSDLERALDSQDELVRLGRHTIGARENPSAARKRSAEADQNRGDPGQGGRKRRRR